MEGEKRGKARPLSQPEKSRVFWPTGGGQRLGAVIGPRVSARSSWPAGPQAKARTATPLASRLAASNLIGP